MPIIETGHLMESWDRAAMTGSACGTSPPPTTSKSSTWPPPRRLPRPRLRARRRRSCRRTRRRFSPGVHAAVGERALPVSLATICFRKNFILPNAFPISLRWIILLSSARRVVGVNQSEHSRCLQARRGPREGRYSALRLAAVRHRDRRSRRRRAGVALEARRRLRPEVSNKLNLTLIGFSINLVT